MGASAAGQSAGKLDGFGKYLSSVSFYSDVPGALNMVAKRLGCDPSVLEVLKSSGSAIHHQNIRNVIEGSSSIQFANFVSNQNDQLSPDDLAQIGPLAKQLLATAACGGDDPDAISLMQQSIISAMAETGLTLAQALQKTDGNTDSLLQPLIAIAKLKFTNALANGKPDDFGSEALRKMSEKICLKGLPSISHDLRNRYLMKAFELNPADLCTPCHLLQHVIQGMVQDHIGSGNYQALDLNEKIQAYFEIPGIRAAVNSGQKPISEYLKGLNNHLYEHLFESEWARNHEPRLDELRNLTRDLNGLTNNYAATLKGKIDTNSLGKLIKDSTLKLLSGLLGTSAQAKTDLAYSILSSALGPHLVQNFDTSRLDGYLVKQPQFGETQFSSSIPKHPQSSDAVDEFGTPRYVAELPSVHASILNFKNPHARQSRFRQSTAEFIQSFQAVSLRQLAPGLPAAKSIDHPVRVISRGLSHSPYACAGSSSPIKLRRKADEHQPNNPIRRALRQFTNNLLEFAVNPAKRALYSQNLYSDSSISISVQDASNKLFLSRFVQAGFSPRKLDRVIRDSRQGYVKNLSINAPKRPGFIEGYSQHHKRWWRYVLPFLSYGMPGKSSGRPSENAAKLLIAEEASIELRAKLITTINGELATTNQDAKTAIIRNLGLDDPSKQFSWGDLAEIAKLVFVACDESTLKEKLNEDIASPYLQSIFRPVGQNVEKVSYGSLLANGIAACSAASMGTDPFVPPALLVKFKQLMQDCVVTSAGREPTFLGEKSPGAREDVQRSGAALTSTTPAHDQPQVSGEVNNVTPRKERRFVFTQESPDRFMYGSVELSGAGVDDLKRCIDRQGNRGNINQEVYRDVFSRLFGHSDDLNNAHSPADRLISDVMIRAAARFGRSLDANDANANLWLGADHKPNDQNLNKMLNIRLFMLSVASKLNLNNPQDLKGLVNLADRYVGCLLALNQNEFDVRCNELWALVPVECKPNDDRPAWACAAYINRFWPEEVEEQANQQMATELLDRFKQSICS